MCLAIPMKVIEVNGNNGVVEISGVRRTTDLSLVAPVEVGQYVVVHAGFAIAVTDEEEARKSIELIQELAEALEAEKAAEDAARRENR